MIGHPASACSLGLVTFHALPCRVPDSLSHALHRNNEPPNSLQRDWSAIDRQGSPRHMGILYIPESCQARFSDPLPPRSRIYSTIARILQTAIHFLEALGEEPVFDYRSSQPIFSIL